MKSLARLACAVAMLVASELAAAFASIDVLPNLIGVGLGATPAYSGADEYIGGVVPGLRYQFKDSNRFIEWYGPTADMNVADRSGSRTAFRA
jgi:hypothetical protein